MTRMQMTAQRAKAALRARRTRAKIRGTSERPRLTVFRSSKYMSAQIIDDTKGVTLFAATDMPSKGKGTAPKGKPMERAAEVGAAIAKLATKGDVTAVVFDRGSYRYHGCVKALADAARANGLQF